ncbi:P-loop containing nucleoside triphosphate hydrolase protein [Cyathus striatus]|nr:P-loop containing nucleoside triphosphate hydrolase protein [Cyathus striatus]
MRVSVLHENALSPTIIADFLKTANDRNIGLSPVYGTKCCLVAVATATLDHVLFIRVGSSAYPAGKTRRNSNSGRHLLYEKILCSPELVKYGFWMDKLSSALYKDMGMQVVNGVDLLSISPSSRDSPQAMMDALGGENTVNKKLVMKLFIDEESSSTSKENTALQAWAACKAAGIIDRLRPVNTLPRIDTKKLSKVHMDLISSIIRNLQRFERLKPRRTKHEILPEVIQKKGEVQVVSKRFKSRVMHTGHNQFIEVVRIISGKRVISTARATHVDGRSVKLAINDSRVGPNIHSITTVGKESATNAESLRTGIMLNILQGTMSILDNPFVKRILIPSEELYWDGVPSAPVAPRITFSARELNKSQRKATQAVLSADNDRRVVLIQGPPGTGKTTVIAAATTSIAATTDKTLTVWLVAQSNVAVKNIAEKLADVGFYEFSILVSKDFHHDWHEHLYEKIIRNLIRSDDFKPSVLGAERHLRGHRVILCTLSMLSHDRLSPYCIVVPPQTLIFDEASQIEVGDYFPMFYRFQKLLPGGNETLDRMPIPIGDFISEKVYNKQLQSRHSITTRSCCRFIDVPSGREIRNGKSWQNDDEVKIVVALAKNLKLRGLSYRIITPYDPQRAALEKALQGAKIPHEDTCFNVDSFQGNEADFIIVSLVRSEKLGFLSQRCRMNVMLTRCKKGMLICTSRSFIRNVASGSLVGELETTLGESCWISSSAVLNNACKLPY